MTQEELLRQVEDHVCPWNDECKYKKNVNKLMTIINQHVDEVIGEAEHCPTAEKDQRVCSECRAVNKRVSQQRKRAVLWIIVGATVIA